MTGHILGPRVMDNDIRIPAMTSSTETLPQSWQRLLALSGVAFGLLLLFGWFLRGIRRTTPRPTRPGRSGPLTTA
jgi:hypothetical protein